MIAVRLERLDLPACSTASQIDPSAISESPQRTQTREGIFSSRAASATPTPIGRPGPSAPAGGRFPRAGGSGAAGAGRQPGAGGAGGDVDPGQDRGGVAFEPRAELAEG